MKQKALVIAMTAICSVVLAGCNDNDANDFIDIITSPTQTGNVLVLTEAGQLASFNSDKPETLISNQTITGLVANDSLIGIDYRPADGKLYGVGSLGNIYIIDPLTTRAELKSKMTADATDMTNAYTAITGNVTLMSVDFNPAADRLRVIGNDGQNLRINVDTGATTTDGVLNGAANAQVTSAAYTNSFAGTANTKLYDIDVSNDRVYLQDPPNNGTLAAFSPLGVNAEGSSSFDIDGVNNQGYAVLTVAGNTQFYKINLATIGAATPVSTLVGNLPTALQKVRGIAMKPAKDAGTRVQGLSANNQLISFKASQPNDVTTIAITGLQASEKIVGIDYRLRTDVAGKSGVLYGLSNSGNLYTIDALTGLASSRIALVADSTDSTLAFAGLSGDRFSVDFNPAADRLRVISNNGQNLRINVDTGATTTDGILNGVSNTQVTAAAYTNSFAGMVSTTALFDLDSNSNNLLKQTPPNDGKLESIGSLAVTLGLNSGFDIAGGDNGLVLASITDTSTNTSSLYRINLTTAATTPAVSVNGSANLQASKIGNSSTPAIIDIAIWLK